MANVQLNPGDVLVVCVTDHERQLGGKSADMLYHFTYDDVLGALNAPAVAKRKGKSRRSKTPGKKLSRQISLMANAIIKGVWSTGAPIKRYDITLKLVEVLNEATDADLEGLTVNATVALNKVLESGQVSPAYSNILNGYLNGKELELRREDATLAAMGR